MICAPRSARPRAVAAPIPDVPPVIITIFPCICRSEVLEAPVESHLIKPTTTVASTTLSMVKKLGMLGTPLNRTSPMKGNGIVESLRFTWDLVVDGENDAVDTRRVKLDFRQGRQKSGRILSLF